jgi:hypothetical protein
MSEVTNDKLQRRHFSQFLPVGDPAGGLAGLGSDPEVSAHGVPGAGQRVRQEVQLRAGLHTPEDVLPHSGHCTKRIGLFTCAQ